MKLRNKKTGKVIEWFDNTDGILPNSLAELNAEWEDAPEEPKEYWRIDCDGTLSCGKDDFTPFDNSCKSLGNYFETREEAEQAVEKLKAVKRLKDKGFRFKNDSLDICRHTINFKVDRQFDMTDETSRDLHLLFGGEE